jgi:hypothetical protein
MDNSLQLQQSNNYLFKDIHKKDIPFKKEENKNSVLVEIEITYSDESDYTINENLDDMSIY